MSKGSLEYIKSKFPEIKKAIEHCNYEVTPGDVSVSTGLPILEVEHALKQLVDDYFGALKVSNEGDLVYFFPTKFRKNRYGSSGKIKQIMKSIVKGLYKAFQFIYKISIMVILVVYFLLFLILLIAIVFAATASNKGGNNNNDDRGSRRGGGGFGLNRILFWFWMGRSSNGSRYERRGDSSYVGESEPSKKEKGKPFYKSVFDFVFGEDDPNEFLYKNINKIVARFIQDKRGAVISEELSPITGTKIQNSGTDVTKYVGKFESEPEVTDNGTVVLTFPKLLTTSHQIEVGNYHSENAYYEEKLKHNGNKAAPNVIMCILNAFNLIMSGLILAGPAEFVLAVAGGKINPDIMAIINVLESHSILLGSFPFVFSLLFFVIPIIRYFVIKSKNAKIRKRNLYKAVALAVMERGPIVRSSGLVLPRESYEYIGSYSQMELENILNDMALSSCCNVEFEGDGSSRYYDFTELHNNLREVGIYRTSTKVGKTITASDIDFNSNDDFFDF